ncbi:hypothetical protein QYM36_005733 [Artemia franciscana]|uniref:Uncharacterized protein n=1 Tax=Artemia franciscana TaxID=6661 RepID=A0AA88LA16_ARTSF|nr:hypothetical protein QYM36_005733 [Artemia franciscana]
MWLTSWDLMGSFSTEDDPGGNFANTALTAPPTVTYQSTCHLVLAHCQSDMICRRYLDPVLRYCDLQLCSRDLCMQSLQAFYREVDTYWAMEVAFCVCREYLDDLKAQYKRLNKQVKTRTRYDKRVYLETMADQAQIAARPGDSRTVYAITNELEGISTASSTQVEKKEGDG